jgi:type IV pilus assembly protein PilQ
MRGARLLLATFTALTLGIHAWGQDPAAPAKAAPQGAVDEDPKAKAIREAYEEQLRRERQEVTMTHRNASVPQIVDDFRRQTGWNIVVDYRNIPEDYRIDEFIVVKETARKALEAFAKKGELTIEDASASLIQMSRPPRLTFNFRDADVKVVIDMIARVSGANIIVSPDVKGSITLSINNVPWQEVLTSVVKTLNFTTVKEGFGIIRIIHPDELLKQMEIRVFPLRYIQPPPTYRAKVEQNKFVSGQPLQPVSSIEEIQRQFILKQVLDTVLSRDATNRVMGQLNFDPGTNVFIVRDTKVVLDKVAEIIQVLDIEPQQVMIDVKFVSTTNRDLLQFGTSWSFAGADGVGASTRVLHPSTFTAPDGTDVVGKITRLPFGLGRESGTPGDQFFLTQYDMSAVFRAFKNDRFSKLIQEPTLSVLDNQEATIFVGETISYAEVRSVQNALGGIDFSLAEASKSPVKVGFQLFVIPKVVIESNMVILTVIPQNEFLSGPSTGAAVPGFTRFTLVSNGQEQSIDLPRVNTTTLVTRLLVESGKTAVLGGLVVERASYEDEGVPVLKDIPLISYLFKNRVDDVSKEHLLIFITPRIVRSRGASESLEKLIRMREDQERREFDQMKKGAEPEKK